MRPLILSNEKISQEIELGNEMFVESLKNWVLETGIDQKQETNRKEAQTRILAANSNDSELLDLSGLNLTSIPAAIGNLSNLKKLHLGYNQIEAIPAEIGNLLSLENLNLNSNQITAIPVEIGNLSSLENLNLNSNQITAIPVEIGNLSKLKELNLYENQITAIPAEIGNLSSLENLDLSQNQIDEIPVEIGNLSSLENLDLYGNIITAIPVEIGNLSSLENLNLNSNQITAIPVEIGNLSKLKELNLYENQITAIPAEIGNLSSLENLDLYGNIITAIPVEIGNLSSLENLNLNSNQITAIPVEIGNLSKLKELNLYENQITAIPAEIGNLSSLEYLNLSYNQITAIPAKIGNLSSLKGLYLYGNQITEIPAEIGNLSSLENLNLIYNQITAIPEEFFTNRILMNQEGSRNGEQMLQLAINLQNNRTSETEVQRIMQLAQNTGIAIESSIFEAPQPQQASQSIVQKIIDQAPTEKKQDIAAFLQQSCLEQFNQFLGECQKTAGWKKDNGKEMTDSLGGLVEQMSQSESLKTKCVAIAADAFGTCGDRVALSYVNMLLAQNIGQTPIEQMQPEQLFEYAKKETITKFLNKEAEEKVEEIRNHGGALDEIETHLAYLQAAPQLGLELPASNMLYQRCSNVSEQDLINAVAKFNQGNADEALVINHIFDDSELRKYPRIEELIASSATKSDTDFQQGETSAQYEKRLKEAQTEAKQAALASISKFFQESRNVSSNSASSSSSSSSAYNSNHEAKNENLESENVSSSSALLQERLPLPPSENQNASQNSAPNPIIAASDALSLYGNNLQNNRKRKGEGDSSPKKPAKQQR